MRLRGFAGAVASALFGGGGGGRAQYDRELALLVQEYYNLPNWQSSRDTQYKDYVLEKHINKSSLAILQSEPRSEVIDPALEPRRFYPIGFYDGDILDEDNPRLGTEIEVGSRYKGGTKEGGLGWHKFESVSIAKSIDLICEGPIGGFCDPDGNPLKFKDSKVATNSNTQPSSDDDYLRAVFLNDFPVKEVKEISSTQRQAVYNVNEFDIDVARTEGEIGTNDQELLESKYQFVAETKQVGAKLWGPHTLDPAAAAAAAGSNITQWDPNSPFVSKRSFVTHLEEKYICIRDTSTAFSPIDNYIRSAHQTPHIVIADPVYAVGQQGVIEGGRLYQSTDIFVIDPDDEFAIGEFIANAEYEPGNIVFERAEYLGTDPFGNDDEAQEEANNEATLLNYEDPDSINVATAYWEAGPNAKKLKKWRAGDAYDIGDIVFESQIKAFKVKKAVAEWDAGSIALDPTAAQASGVEVISLEDPSYFESKTNESAGGFLSAVSMLDPQSFFPLNIKPGAPGADKYWSEIFAGDAPDGFTDIASQPLYHDPSGEGETKVEHRSPVLKK